MKTSDLEKLIAQATALPWKSSRDIGTNGVWVRSEKEMECGNGVCQNIASICGYLPPLPERKQQCSNADLIAYAVNNILRVQQERDAAVEVLREFSAGGMDVSRTAVIFGPGCENSLDKARAILAQIETAARR